MVICKFYRQGNCRYGQYCQFEHINNFGHNPSNRNKTYGDKNILLSVAEEVICAEKGGQWLLSCFCPFKEKQSIPGMEDLSPEEVRWEMYQAQKNGMVEQAKIQYQQLCQDMKAKREALKHPTPELLAMLEKLQESNTTTNNIGKSNFPFSNSQLIQQNTNSASNVFGNKLFNQTSNNVFGGNFGGSGGNSYGRTNNDTTSVFSPKPSFGGNTTFASPIASASIFGGNKSNSVFGGTTPSTQVFGQSAQSNPTFTANSTTAFRQQAVFSSTNNNVFAPSSTTQSSASVFGTNTMPTSSIFGTPTTSQSQGSSVFGNSKASPGNPFATSSTTPNSNTIFGTSTSTVNASIFGTATNFSNNSSPGSIFGGQAFASPNNLFGGSNTAPTFNVSTPQSTPQSTSNVFGVTQAPPAFGTNQPVTSIPFVSSSQFISNNMTPEQFSTPIFKTTVCDASTALNTVSSTVSFNTNIPANQPSYPLSLGTSALSWAPTSTTVTTTTSNPFAPKEQMISPFGNVLQNPTTASFSSSVFGSVQVTLDDNVYTPEGLLTDDEKKMYLAEKFILGKVPLKPPTKDIR